MLEHAVEQGDGGGAAVVLGAAAAGRDLHEGEPPGGCLGERQVEDGDAQAGQAGDELAAAPRRFEDDRDLLVGDAGVGVGRGDRGREVVEIGQRVPVRRAAKDGRQLAQAVFELPAVPVEQGESAILQGRAALGQMMADAVV